MKVRVYFSKEPDTVEVILKTQKISRQALDTIYELVWEGEFKNILNAGRIWLKFKENEERPFGIPLRVKRTHTNIAPGDIIQIIDDFYVANQIGTRKIELID
jgi:translation initiation factor IF-1